MALHDKTVDSSAYSSTVRRVLNGWWDEAGSAYRYVSENRPLPVTIVNAEFVLDGNVNVDVSAFRQADGTRADAWIYTDNLSLNGVTEFWQGVGAYDAENDTFRALRIFDGDNALNGGFHLSVAGEVVDFDTGAGTDFTPSMGMLGASSSGAVPLLLTPAGSLVVDVDGIYSASNTDPDNVGLIVHDITPAPPGDAQQTIRVTGGTCDYDTLSENLAYGIDARSITFFDDSSLGVNRRQQGESDGNAFVAIRDGTDKLNVIAHSATVEANGIHPLLEAAEFDGVAFSNAVSDGEAVRPKASLYGVQYNMLVSEDGTKTVHALDHTLQVATPDLLNMGGEYRAAVDTYDDGDAVITHYNINGDLMTSTGVEYAEDAQHTTGDEGNFVLGIRTDTLGTGVNIAGTDRDYMGLQMNAKGSLYTDVSSVLGADMAVTNGVYSLITDNTTACAVNPGYAATEAIATASLFTTAGMYGTDLANGGGATLLATQVAVDNTTVGATPNVLIGGGIYKAALDTYGDNDAVPFHFDVNGRMLVDIGTATNNAAFGETEDEASSSEFMTCGIYGLDTEAGAGSQLRAVQVAVDNAAASATPNILIGGGVYKAALDTYDDNDAVPFTFDVNGNLLTLAQVTLNDFDDDSVFTPGTSSVLAIGMFADETAPDSVDEGDIGIPRMTLDRKQLIASNFQEDTAHTTGDYGTQVLAVRNDTLATLAGTDGDYAPLQVTSGGALYTQEVLVGTQDSAAGTVGPQIMAEAKDFDGSALPNAVQEGDAVRPASSLSGVQFIMPVDETGANTPLVAHDAVINAANGGSVGFMPMLNARSSQNTAVSNADACRPIANIYGEQVIAGYTWATQSLRTEEIDPIPEKYVSETLADVTNGADATYYYYFDMNGFKFFAIQATLNGGSGTATMTCEATIQDDGTAPATCTYIDVTNDLFGVASTVASDMWVADEVNAFKYVRIKIVAATGAADDADWTLYLKKLY